MTAALAGLLEAIGAAPSLPGARCRGRSSEFDETDCPETIEYALNLCRSCPALTACTAWVASLPPRKRPPGVVAAQLNTQTPRRPRKATTA